MILLEIVDDVTEQRMSFY